MRIVKRVATKQLLNTLIYLITWRDFNMSERMVGKQAPRFEMDAVMPNKEFNKVSLEENMNSDKWTVLFFYPMDFTFVCPTEITAMSDRFEEFDDLDAVVIGASTDTIHTHLAWVKTDRKENGLGDLNY